MKRPNLNMFGGGEGIEDGKRKVVLERDDFTCQECGTDVSQSRGGDGEFANIHHVIPLSKGGSDDLENLTTLCRRCHLEAHHDGGFEINGVQYREVDVLLLDYLTEGRVTPAYCRDRIQSEGHRESITSTYCGQRLQRLEEHGHVTNLLDTGLYELVSDPRHQ